MQQKKDSFGTVFEKFLPKPFLKFSAKKVLCVLGYIFNKVNKGIVEKLCTSEAQYCFGS